MKHMYIITNSSFPYGNANSNYIRYFSLALVSQGWNVTVIGSNMYSENVVKGEYRGVRYNNIQFPKTRIPFHLRDHFGYGKRLKKEIKKSHIENDAYIFVYSMYMDLVNTVLKELSSLPEGHLSIAMVEWFQPYQYRYGKFNPDYCCWKRTFEKFVPSYKKVFPISRNLQSYYNQCGCQTLLLPVMADTQEHSPSDVIVDNEGIRHFIYPGNATNKDSFEGVIGALGALSNDELKKIKMHFTTLSKKKVYEFVADGEVAQKLSEVCVFHGLLPYNRLLQLYQSMDFIFLAREKNIVTLSNFPSKIPELMCYSVVPVCSNVGDYAELYLQNNVDSIIFEGADVQSCLNAFRRSLSLSNEELIRMKEAARKCAVERFDYHNWSKKISDFLLS